MQFIVDHNDFKLILVEEMRYDKGGVVERNRLVIKVIDIFTKKGRSVDKYNPILSDLLQGIIFN